MGNIEIKKIEIPEEFNWSFTHKAHKKNWYIILFIFYLFLFAFNYFLLGNNLLFLGVLIFSLVFLVFNGMKDRTVHFQIKDSGIVLESQEIKWDNLKGFSLASYDDEKILFLLPKTFPYFKIMIPYTKEDEDTIKEYLMLKLKKININDTWVDMLVRFFIF